MDFFTVVSLHRGPESEPSRGDRDENCDAGVAAPEGDHGLTGDEGHGHHMGASTGQTKTGFQIEDSEEDVGNRACKEKACPFHCGIRHLDDGAEALEWEPSKIFLMHVDTLNNLNAFVNCTDYTNGPADSAAREERLKRLAQRIRRNIMEAPQAQEIVFLCYGENHYTFTAINLVTKTMEHWDCLRRLGNSRKRHLPRNILELVKPLMEKIFAGIATDEIKVAEMECEQQGDGKLDCAIHSARALLHKMKRTPPRTPLRTCAVVDAEMRGIRRRLGVHFRAELKDFQERHAGGVYAVGTCE